MTPPDPEKEGEHHGAGWGLFLFEPIVFAASYKSFDLW